MSPSRLSSVDLPLPTTPTMLTWWPISTLRSTPLRMSRRPPSGSSTERVTPSSSTKATSAPGAEDDTAVGRHAGIDGRRSRHELHDELALGQPVDDLHVDAV